MVVNRHALRNALIPVVTVIALDVPTYFTGALLVEVVFSWPGMGRLFFDALKMRFVGDGLRDALDPRSK